MYKLKPNQGLLDKNLDSHILKKVKQLLFDSFIMVGIKNDKKFGGGCASMLASRARLLRLRHHQHDCYKMDVF